MNEIIKLLNSGTKQRFGIFIVIAALFGYQYSELKARLVRIEDRIGAIEVSQSKTVSKQ